MTTPANMPFVYISAGSNIKPLDNLQAAVDALREQCEILAISSVYQSPPFGYLDQPDFLDIAIKLQTPILPAAFKQILTDIEKAQGRDRANQESKYGPLPLDMDILLWGENAFNYGEKPHYVPDKGIVKYAAVAVPLAEIAPDVMHPLENRTIANIAAGFDGTDLPIKTTHTIT